MIFYYSRTRKTETAAQALHEITGLPLYTLESGINDAKGFSFAWKAMRSVMGAKGFAVVNMPAGVPGEIYLCGPVWAGEPAGPLKYFIANADLTKTKVHVILTAMMPTDQYRTAICKVLERAGAQVGEVLLLAMKKGMPEPDVLREHINGWLNEFASVASPLSIDAQSPTA